MYSLPNISPLKSHFTYTSRCLLNTCVNFSDIFLTIIESPTTALQYGLMRYISLRAGEVIMNDDIATVQREFRILVGRGNFEAQYFLDLMHDPAQPDQDEKLQLQPSRIPQDQRSPFSRIVWGHVGLFEPFPTVTAPPLTICEIHSRSPSVSPRNVMALNGPPPSPSRSDLQAATHVNFRR